MRLWPCRDKRGSAGFQQASYLGDAGVLGELFVTTSEKFYARVAVDACADRPAYDFHSLGAYLA